MQINVAAIFLEHILTPSLIVSLMSATRYLLRSNSRYLSFFVAFQIILLETDTEWMNIRAVA